MKDLKYILLKISSFLLILLWVYTASSKLLNFNDFKVQMSRQAIPDWMMQLLILTLPATELAAAALLLFSQTQTAGFWVSFVLMSIFTGYIEMVLFGVFGQVPCSCGGVIKIMGWTIHLYFNLFFWLITIASILTIYKKRRVTK